MAQWQHFFKICKKKKKLLGYKVTIFLFTNFFVVVFSYVFSFFFPRHFVAYFSSKIRRSMHLKKFWVSSFFAGFGMILLLIMGNNADKFRLLIHNNWSLFFRFLLLYLSNKS